MERTTVVEQLHEVASLLDRMCWDALTAGPENATMSLFDASQAVHRALIALAADEGQENAVTSR